MASSQLKQLKASIHARRVAKNGKGRTSGRKPQTQTQTQVQRRPKSQGEERRRKTLLSEIQSRHKAGGIVDRRIGENDPTMAQEDRMIERYKKQHDKRKSVFNLEDDVGEDQLTHGGLSLFEKGSSNTVDNLEAPSDAAESDVEDELLQRAKKRRRLSQNDGENPIEALEDVSKEKKSKKEVMEEIIAKSKMHKYERQKEREEDQDVREELDKGLPDLLSVLRGNSSHKASAPPATNGDRKPDAPTQAILNCTNPEANQRKEDYDQNIQRLAMDKRAQPTERTKTAEELAQEHASHLKELEEARMRRMRGERQEPQSGESDQEDSIGDAGEGETNEAARFGLKDTLSERKPGLDVEDEDEFLIDEDLVASGSEIDSDISLGSEEDTAEHNDEEDMEFLRDVLPNGTKSTEFVEPPTLPYTYPCPQNHNELIEITQNVPYGDLNLVIQRIRALYNLSLAAENKAKMSNFSSALAQHIAYLGSHKVPFDVVEVVIRHVHSLAKTFPESTASAFRPRLQQMQQRLAMEPGDLFVLTAIGKIYPTSDHFHQVVTPAITIMARWLAMTSPSTEQNLTTGAYIVALCIMYQAFSKRYVPEAIRFTIAAIKETTGTPACKMHVSNLSKMIDIWRDKSAFIEIFAPSALEVLEATGDKKAIQKLRIVLTQAQISRRALELHHHRPLPIRTAIPKFEENFHPDKHYDPDEARAEATRLRKEYKKEKKGAIRELRKDASFIAREKLRAKKEADRAYEQKQRKLIAEIQADEGREKNEYEREKRKRKGIR